jgi:hypothetical protein
VIPCELSSPEMGNLATLPSEYMHHWPLHIIRVSLALDSVARSCLPLLLRMHRNAVFGLSPGILLACDRPRQPGDERGFTSAMRKLEDPFGAHVSE